MRSRSIVRRLRADVAALQVPGPDQATTDPARHDWYGQTCPCELPPGECREHPRARATQRPPADESWRLWFMMAGRGSGKTRAGAEWVRHIAESGQARRIALVGPTEQAVKKIMVEGNGRDPGCQPGELPAGLFAADKRLRWPDGVVATCFSADQPETLARAGA